MIKIRISDKEMLDSYGQTRSALERRLRLMGFTTLDGWTVRVRSDLWMTTIIEFYPTRRDLTFKRFDRWVPLWQAKKQKRNEILNRRFKP